MAKYGRVKKDKKVDEDRKRRTKQQDSKPLVDQSLAWDTGPSSLTETPFYPRMEEHAAMLSSIPSAVQRNNFIMQLHQTYGNRYVQRLMESTDVQAKLTVSVPGDIYEQEADRVGDAVTSTINSPVQRQPDEEEELLQGKSLIQQQPEEEEELQMMPDLQHQPEEEEEVQMKASHTQHTEDVKKVQKYGASMSIQRMAPFSGEKENIVGKAKGIGRGWNIEVDTDAGTTVIGWTSDEAMEAIFPPEKLPKEESLVAGKELTGKEFGESFFCHGFSLGTFGKYGYSVYGDFVHKVLEDEYNYIGDLKSARNLKKGDICVIGPLERPAHSCVVAEDRKGKVNPKKLITDSKNIFGALEKNFPLRKHMDQYKAYPQITFFRKK